MKDKNQRDESEIKIALEYSNNIIATLREPFLVLDKNLRIISTNQAFYTTFEVREIDTIGRLLPDLGNRQWNIPKLLELLKEIIPEKKVIKDYEVEHKFEHIGERAMILNACQLRVPKKIAGIIAVGVREEEEEEEEEELILLAIEDITERRKAEKKEKELTAHVAAAAAAAAAERKRAEELDKAYKQLKETQEKLIRLEKLAALGKLAGIVGTKPFKAEALLAIIAGLVRDTRV